MPLPSDVVIIGAGPAGLTAAHELRRRGVRSLVLEADSQPGGLSKTCRFKDCRFDIGGHRFFTRIPRIQTLWRDVLGDALLEKPRYSRIYYRGAYFRYPISLDEIMSKMGRTEALRIGLSLAAAKIRPAKRNHTFEAWVSRRFGRRMFDLFFKAYTEKIWGLPCSEISSDWASQRIQNLTAVEILRHILPSFKNNKNPVPSLIDAFYYPLTGAGMMWEKLANDLTRSGVNIVYDAKIHGIVHRKKRIERLCCVSPDGVQSAFEGADFISSMPLRDLIASLTPAPPASVLDAARRLKYRNHLSVLLIIRREHVFPDQWIYVPSPEFTVGRIQNFKNWSADMVPDSSISLLGLEFFLCEADHGSDPFYARLIDIGIDECEKMGLIKSSDVLDAAYYPAEKAYPVYQLDYRRHLRTLQQYLKGFENLQTIGRNGLHRYNNQDHSMLTGVYAARNLAGENHDVWAVNA